MADEPGQDPAAADPNGGAAEPAGGAAEPREEAAERPSGGGAVNSQIVDSIAALHTLAVGGSPALSSAMLSAVAADSIGLAMLNAVARQQADGLIASAAVASICARLAGAPLPEGAAPPATPQFVAAAEAQAQAAILLLKSQAQQSGDMGEEARAALARLAAAAAPSPPDADEAQEDDGSR